MHMLAFGQPQQLPASRAVRRDQLHPCSMPERPQAWSPSNVHAVVSGVHNGRHDRTAFRTPPARSYPAGHRPLHSARQPNRKRCGQGTDERHGRHSDILDRHDHEGGPPGHAELPAVGRRLRLGNQGWLGDGNAASATVTTAATRQPLGVALQSKPRLGALLSSCKGSRCLIRTRVPGLHVHPGWFRGWR
jgi:hypothetical protein